ncbi:hypothetical protein CRENBAI_011600 [Crenichthys baileyi]|uniref:Uncharacterized protein n=1 Tax=Crenichthys baileyi TaxID=28760 RepID=A0AAV9S7A8_9TELE
MQSCEFGPDRTKPFAELRSVKRAGAKTKFPPSRFPRKRFDRHGSVFTLCTTPPNELWKNQPHRPTLRKSVSPRESSDVEEFTPGKVPEPGYTRPGQPPWAPPLFPRKVPEPRVKLGPDKPLGSTPGSKFSIDFCLHFPNDNGPPSGRPCQVEYFASVQARIHLAWATRCIRGTRPTRPPPPPSVTPGVHEGRGPRVPPPPPSAVVASTRRQSRETRGHRVRTRYASRTSPHTPASLRGRRLRPAAVKGNGGHRVYTRDVAGTRKGNEGHRVYKRDAAGTRKGNGGHRVYTRATDHPALRETRDTGCMRGTRPAPLRETGTPGVYEGRGRPP